MQLQGKAQSVWNPVTQLLKSLALGFQCASHEAATPCNNMTQLCPLPIVQEHSLL